MHAFLFSFLFFQILEKAAEIAGASDCMAMVSACTVNGFAQQLPLIQKYSKCKSSERVKCVVCWQGTMIYMN